MSDAIERNLSNICNSRPKSRITLEAHPYVIAYLREGWPSLRMRWRMKYNKWLRVHTNTEFALNQYKFYDQNDDEIRMG